MQWAKPKHPWKVTTSTSRPDRKSGKQFILRSCRMFSRTVRTCRRSGSILAKLCRWWGHHPSVSLSPGRWIVLISLMQCTECRWANVCSVDSVESTIEWTWPPLLSPFRRKLTTIYADIGTVCALGYLWVYECIRVKSVKSSVNY